MANRTQENASIYSHIQATSGRISRIWLTEHKKMPLFIAIFKVTSGRKIRIWLTEHGKIPLFIAIFKQHPEK